MKKFFRPALFAALALCALSAAAQTAAVTERWGVVPLDAPRTDPALSLHTTQAICKQAVRSLNRTRKYTCELQLDAVASIVVPPTCTTPRPADSQVLQCPTGQTGSWTQTRSVTATTYPTCWTTSAWTPSGAPAGACTPIVVPPPPPPPPAGSTTYVNPALVPVGKISVGSADRRIRTTGERPGPDAGGIGASRTICPVSHFAFDDPLVFPRQPGVSHLHVFWGNSLTDAFSTPESILTTGNSGCRGGIINRSAYWAPAMIDTRDGRPLVPMPTTGPDEKTPIYYKTGYHGVRDADVKPFPQGFRMIAGDSKSRVGQTRVVEYSCGTGWFSTIPSCSPGSIMRMAVVFPQCWNGRDLSSPDHRSHVAYPRTPNGCNDPAFPIALPEISIQIDYLVPSSGNSTWRLSSDISGTPAGSSAHADWMNGWEQEIVNLWVTRVINPGFSASGGLGDGRSLY